jgi:hypothetical protein
MSGDQFRRPHPANQLMSRIQHSMKRSLIPCNSIFDRTCTYTGLNKAQYNLCSKEPQKVAVLKRDVNSKQSLSSDFKKQCKIIRIYTANNV